MIDDVVANIVANRLDVEFGEPEDENEAEHKLR
jgi:hypothetical protein